MSITSNTLNVGFTWRCRKTCSNAKAPGEFSCHVLLKDWATNPRALSLNRTPELGHNQCLKQMWCWAMIQLLMRNRAVCQYVLIGQGIVSHCLADSGIMYSFVLSFGSGPAVISVEPSSCLCFHLRRSRYLTNTQCHKLHDNTQWEAVSVRKVISSQFQKAGFEPNTRCDCFAAKAPTQLTLHARSSTYQTCAQLRGHKKLCQLCHLLSNNI